MRKEKRRLRSSRNSKDRQTDRRGGRRIFQIDADALIPGADDGGEDDDDDDGGGDDDDGGAD